MRVRDLWEARDDRFSLVVDRDGHLLRVVSGDAGLGEVRFDDVANREVASVRPDAVAGSGNAIVAVLASEFHNYCVNWNNNGRYSNFDVRASNHRDLWAEIKSRINPDLVMSVMRLD